LRAPNILIKDGAIEWNEGKYIGSKVEARCTELSTDIRKMTTPDIMTIITPTILKHKMPLYEILSTPNSPKFDHTLS